jgi:hypothetical protein
MSVNVGVQISARPFTEQLTPVIYTERALISAPHAGEGGMMTLDIGGGARVWRNFGIGGVYTKFASTETVTVAARVPHPSFFNQPRAANKAVPFVHDESAIHVQGVFVLPLSSRLDVAVSAGPSFIDLRQDLVQSIEIAEAAAPFATVTLANVALLTRNVNVKGMNVGGDVTWFLTPLVGIGMTARYVVASTTLTSSGGGPVEVDAGGFQLGFGARIRLR